MPAGPPVLVVAPLAGHFATLLRDTITTLLAEHDVYVTDWHNVRDVPLDEGELDMDGAIEHVMRFLRVLGPAPHLFAVCQPCPTALVAAAILAEDGDEATPATMTLMAGPVDARVNPTRVNEVAVSRPLEWFERRVITTVPSRYAGRGRRVYPGFLQLAGFMSMNPYLHAKRHLDAYASMVGGDERNLEVIEAFYREYYAMLDLPARFYLETVDHVFQRFDLARGERTWRGRPVDLTAIADTALLTVEGGRDDVCGTGQTAAAHGLCSRIPDDRRFHHLEPTVGHYGVFSGLRWRNAIHPAVREFIAAHDRAHAGTS
jgi:polyhydroxyalkanoate depolymerase